jgi:DNA-binding NarL/FixJ family response regulator
MIRVCLVEDHLLVRQGLAALLLQANDIEIVAEAGDGQKALEVIPKTKPDVLLLDMRLPKLSGLEVLQTLQAQTELPPTIILTSFQDQQTIFKGLQAGAKGYLLKDISFDRLVEAIRTVARGGTSFQPGLSDHLLSNLLGSNLLGSNLFGQCPSDTALLDLPVLTKRETEVLRLIAGGHSNRAIATLFHLAEGTVRNHTLNIFSKLGVHDRTQAVLKAIELSLI